MNTPYPVDPQHPASTQQPASTPGQVTVNGNPQALAGQETVETLVIRLLGSTRAGVAVAVNGAVLPAGQWSQYPLIGGEDIEILTAFQGG